MTELFQLEGHQIDWKLLRQQKRWLANLTVTGRRWLAPGETRQADGLLNFIDYVQDAAVAQGAVFREGGVRMKERPLDFRKAAAKEIAHLAKTQDRILQAEAKLRLVREHILRLCGELGFPKELELAALGIKQVIELLEAERAKHV